MAHQTPEEFEDLARTALTEAHNRALRQHEGGRATAQQLWTTARRRRTRRHGVGAVVLAVAVVGVSGPLWWPSAQPAHDQVAATVQPSESVSPAAPSTPPQDESIPTTLPDGQPYDHDRALVGDRASNIIDAMRDKAGYAGLHVDPQTQAIILHWAGPAPESVATQARELAGPSELVVDPTARFSRTDLIAVMNMVSDKTSDELMMMGMEPNYLIGQITVQALPESPLHTAADPAALMGIADQGVNVKVVVIQPEDVPVQ